MSAILYYSNACDNSKRLLQRISTSNSRSELHFVCVDKRRRRDNGSMYVILSNGQEILLPSTVTKVPALLLLNRGHEVVFGEDINNHLGFELPSDAPYMAQRRQPAASESAPPVAQPMEAPPDAGEPQAFSLGGGCGFGVSSDQFSFVDQDPESLSAKGNGGLRQLHHYAGIDHDDTIRTPADEYRPDTIGEVSLEQIQQERSKDVAK